MPANIEIKAVADDLDRIRTVAVGIATEPGQMLHQVDVFFRVHGGRLKLRSFSAGSGELIYYERPDRPGARQSRYQIYATSQPQELRSLLAAALDETVIVKKKREVFLVGQTRIHLDEVDELGTFVEVEVVLKPGQSAAEGQQIVVDLMHKLGIEESDLVSCAYADLLAATTPD